MPTPSLAPMPQPPTDTEIQQLASSLAIARQETATLKARLALFDRADPNAPAPSAARIAELRQMAGLPLKSGGRP